MKPDSDWDILILLNNDKITFEVERNVTYMERVVDTNSTNYFLNIVDNQRIKLVKVVSNITYMGFWSGLNNRSVTGFVFLLLTLVVVFPACKTSRKTVHPTVKTNVEHKSTQELSELLKKNEFSFDWITAKFSSDVIIDSNKISFNVTLRGKKDSVIWMSISPALGIEVARVMITKDTVKFIKRINNPSHFIGDFNYISKLLHADLDYDMIQALLFGNSVEFYNDDDQLRSFTENNQYALSTTRRKKSKKVLTKNKELKEPIQIIWLEPETYKISRILFKDFNTERTFDAHFSNFALIDSLAFPYQADYNIKAEKNIQMRIEYSKISLHVPQTFPFSIDKKSKRIEYQER